MQDEGGQDDTQSAGTQGSRVSKSAASAEVEEALGEGSEDTETAAKSGQTVGEATDEQHDARESSILCFDEVSEERQEQITDETVRKSPNSKRTPPHVSATSPGHLSARPQTASSSLPITPTTPGPYLTNGVRGGRFGTGTPKSDVDWKIHRAKQVPGPGAYGLLDSKKLLGGRFSTCSPKSDVEWEMLRASKIPAPGQYELKSHAPSGGKFSISSPKSDLDWKMIRAAQVHSTSSLFIDV